MPLSIADQLQKLQDNITALEIRQLKLKERIAHQVMWILDQEQAFAIDSPLLLGAILQAVQQLKKLDAASPEKAHITQLGEAFLKRHRRRQSPAKAESS